MPDADVIDLFGEQDDRPFVRVIWEAADSLANPYLCRASDGHYYWCKQLQNRQGYEVVINEVVGSMVGQRIGAPIRSWEILDVPEEFVGTFIPKSKIRVGAGPVFGSLNIHEGEVNLMDWGIEFADRDGNYRRLPHLIALWYLTNAQDLQVIFDEEADSQVWSIDHGQWFDSDNQMWALNPSDMKAGKPEVPTSVIPIPNLHWDEAIENVDKLDASLAEEINKVIPEEWDIDPRIISRLVDYAVGRKSITKEWLHQHRDRDAARLSR